MMEKARELPPPYKIPIRTIDVEIDPTPRPSLFRNDDSSNSLSDMGRENKDVIYVGVFDRIPQRFHILAPLNDCGEPHIADYNDLYPGSNTPIGIQKVPPRSDSSDYDSSDSSDSSSSSSSTSAAARRRRSTSLGSFPKHSSKKKSKAREIERFMELEKTKGYGRADERARDRAREREKEREKERERKEREKKERENAKPKRKSSSKVTELNRPVQEKKTKKKDKK